MCAEGTQHILRCTPSYAGNFQFHRNASWPSSGWGVRSGSGREQLWPMGDWGESISGLGWKGSPVQDVSWVIWLLKVSELLSSRCAIDWGGDLETRRHRFLDVCVRLSLCVCVCFFVLSGIVSIQIWHFTFAVHFAQIANVTPNSGPL